MLPSGIKSVQNHPLYKESGFGISTKNAEIKISQIGEYNAKNSQFIKHIRLGPYNVFDVRFPDKFSHDLKDIERTCEIEAWLIRKIDQLEKEKAFYQNAQVKLISDFQGQIQKLTSQVNASRMQKKKVQEDLEKEIEVNKMMKIKLNQSRKIENDLRLANGKIEQMEKEFEKQRTKNSNRTRDYGDLQMREMMYKSRITNKSHFQMVNPSKVPEELKAPKVTNNSVHVEEAKKNMDNLVSYYQKHHQKQHDQVVEESYKLKTWLTKFIQRVEKILKIRLQKLRQNGFAPQEISNAYKYLGKMHLNPSSDPLDKDDFPFSQMLDDFQNIVKVSDENKLEIDKYKAVNQAKALNRDIIRMAADSLRRLHSNIIESFKMLGDKCQFLKKEYEKFIKPQLNGIQWIQNFKPEEMVEVSTLPETILNELKKLSDITEDNQKLVRNSQYLQAHCIRDIETIILNIESFCENQNDQQIRNQQIQKLAGDECKQRKEIKKKLEQKRFINEDETIQQRQRRQKELNSQVLKTVFMGKLKINSVDMDIKRVENQVEPSRNSQDVRNGSFQALRNEKNYGDDVPVENKQNSREQLERGMRMIQTKKKEANEEKDIEI